VTDIGHLEQIRGHDAVDDPAGSPDGEECPISLERVEHWNPQLREVAKHLELGDDLVLNGNGQRGELFFGPGQKLNPSCHWTA
jgi:hypothetical protein